jgi:hypothetical protein
MGEAPMIRTRLWVVLLSMMLLWSLPAESAASGMTVTGARTDRLVPAALLTASDATGPLSFAAVASSGEIVVADSYRTPQDMPAVPAGIFVFTEPRGGWSNETPAAQLMVPSAEQNAPVAISASSVYVGGVGTGGVPTVYVFTEPSGGWSGTVQPSAVLTPTGDPYPNLPTYSLAATGGTLAAHVGVSEYVFEEPAGGWTGTVHQSASLVESSGASLGQVAMSGRVLVAGGSVFVEPSGGWSGTLSPTATLREPQTGPVAISGSTIVMASDAANQNDQDTLSFFSEPKAGWSGTVDPVGTRTITAHFEASLSPDLAVSGGRVIAVSVDTAEHECPCFSYIFDANKPPAGWTGAGMLSPAFPAPTNGISNPAVLTEGPSSIALDGPSLAIGGVDGVHIFNLLAPPRLVRLTLEGTATGSPRLSLTMIAAPDNEPIASVALKLSTAIRTTKNQQRLAKGITITGARKPLIRVEHGALVLGLRTPTRRISLTIARPALLESQNVVNKLTKIIKFNRKHRHKHTLNLALALTITDFGHHSTPFTAHIRLPSTASHLERS